MRKVDLPSQKAARITQQDASIGIIYTDIALSEIRPREVEVKVASYGRGEDEKLALTISDLRSCGAT